MFKILISVNIMFTNLVLGPAMVYAKYCAAITLSPFKNKPQYIFVTGGYSPSGQLSALLSL